jgi:hypothetical protein
VGLDLGGLHKGLIGCMVIMRSRISEPLVGAWNNCFKLCLDKRFAVWKSLKSPSKKTRPQLGYWLRWISALLVKY